MHVFVQMNSKCAPYVHTRAHTCAHAGWVIPFAPHPAAASSCWVGGKRDCPPLHAHLWVHVCTLRHTHLCMCMQMHMHMCKHMCVHLCAHAGAYACMHMPVHVQAHAGMCVQALCTHMYTCTCVCMCTHVQAHVPTCAHMCM